MGMAPETAVWSDAHLHLADLRDRDPDFADTLPAGDWAACASAHDRAEWERSESLRALILARRPHARIFTTFGIHPQNPVMDDADFLASLARERKIDAIGEAGFDFFGDIPARTRSAEAMAAQSACFEFQLALAEAAGLPLLVHVRRATDILMGYGRRLARLRAVIFHSWPGRAAEGNEFLRKGVNAYFSFGTPILRDGPRTRESCAQLSADRILSETDAPWQPPFGSPYTKAGDIARVVSHIAKIRGADEASTRAALRANLLAAFG